MRFRIFLIISFTVCFSGFFQKKIYSSIRYEESFFNDKRDSVVLSADFMSSAIYAGRNYGIEQIGLNPSVAYFHKSGLSLRFYGYGMGKTEGLLSLLDFGISFKFNLHPKLTVTPGLDYLYNKFEANKELFSAVNLGVNLNLSYLSVSNYVGFSFGGRLTSWYEECSVSKYYNIFYREKFSLAIAPTLVGILGTKYSQTLIYNGELDTTTTVDSYDFMPLCAGFQLPVTLNWQSFSMTFSPRYDIPLNVIKPLELSLSGNPVYFTFKLTYIITFPKKANHKANNQNVN